MKESNNPSPVPSLQVINATSSAKTDKVKSLFRVLRHPPQPHMCVQDYLVKSCKPCFINVLSWSKLSPPSNPLDPIPLYGGMKVTNHSTNALKFTISSYSELGAITQHPEVFAVMAHPEVLKVSGKKCTDLKDRDAFIDLMLDFVEAMNPGVKFQRQFVVLGDRDIAGELKDIWYTVHNKRQQDKMSHSSHGETDLNYYSKTHSDSDTTIRVYKQATKSLVQLSVKELCPSMNVAPVLLSHTHFSDDSDISNNLTDSREVLHEEHVRWRKEKELAGWRKENMANETCLSLQSLPPHNFDPSLSSSPLSEAPSFPISEKKTLQEEVQVAPNSQLVNSSTVIDELPIPLLHVSILEDTTSFSSTSKVVISLDNNEKETRFGFHTNKHISNEPIEAVLSADKDINVTYATSEAVNKSSHPTKEFSVDAMLGNVACDLHYSAITLCQDTWHRSISNDQSQAELKSNHCVEVLSVDSMQGSVASFQIVPETNQPVIILCDDTHQQSVVYDQSISFNNTAADELQNKQDILEVLNEVHVNHTSESRIFEGILVNQLELFKCEHTSDCLLPCEECSGENKENNSSKNIKKTTSNQQNRDLPDCDHDSKDDDNLIDNVQTYPINTDAQNETFYEEFDLNNSPVALDLLHKAESDELETVSSFEGKDGKEANSVLNNPVSAMTVPISTQSPKNALGIAKSNRATEDIVSQSSDAQVEGEDNLAVSTMLSIPIPCMNDLNCLDENTSKETGQSSAAGKHKKSCNLSDVPRFAHSTMNNASTLRFDGDKLLLDRPSVSQKSTPVNNSKSSFKFGRKSSNTNNIKSKEPLLNPGNNSKKPSSTIAVVAEKHKASVSPIRQSPVNEYCHATSPGGPHNQTAANPRSSNVAARLRRQGMKTYPLNVVSNTPASISLLQSFGVVVPKENSSRRSDRKRNSKACEMSLKPLVNTTVLPLSTASSKGSSDRCSRKNAARNIPPSDSNNKSKNVYDSNCRTLRRSLSEFNKSDENNLLVTGSNASNSSELVNVQTATNMVYSLSCDSLKTEVCQEFKVLTGMDSKSSTESDVKMCNHTFIENNISGIDSSNSKHTEENIGYIHTRFCGEHDTVDCDLTCNIESLTLAASETLVNPHISEEAGTILLRPEDQVAIEKESGGNMCKRSEENSQCSTVLVEFVPSLDTVAFLNEGAGKAFSLYKNSPILGTIITDSDFPNVNQESISTDSLEEVPQNRILLDVGDNCPQLKTEFQTHQDNASCKLDAVNSVAALCTDAVGHQHSTNDLESNL